MRENVGVTLTTILLFRAEENHRQDIRRNNSPGSDGKSHLSLHRETAFQNERKTWHENGRTVLPLDIDTDA